MAESQAAREGKLRTLVDVTAKPRVLITRSPRQASELATQLRELGLEPVLVPAIEIGPPWSFEALDGALARISTFHWVVFTSANAVEALQERLAAGGLEIAKVFAAGSSPRIAAIGPATARALESVGVSVDLVPAQAVAESLTNALLPYVRQLDGTATRFLLVRAEDAREVLPETLRAAGAEVIIAPAYRTVVANESIEIIRRLFEDPAQLAAITFTSSSTARNLLALCEAAGVNLPDSALRVSIGPITSETLRSLGYPPHAEAESATVVALAEAVSRAVDGTVPLRDNDSRTSCG